MKIVVVQGSTRAGSQSRKVADVLIGKLQKMEGVETKLIDLHESPLPIYDDTKKPEWETMKQDFVSADGFVWVVPEWSGTAGPGIMNLAVYLGEGGQAAHKPVLLAAVSSGAGGAYPLAQIKAHTGKNGRWVVVPEPLRFRDIGKIFNSNEPDSQSKVDQTMHERSQYSLEVLVEYIDALSKMRSETGRDYRKYKSGY